LTRLGGQPRIWGQRSPHAKQCWGALYGGVQGQGGSASTLLSEEIHPPEPTYELYLADQPLRNCIEQAEIARGEREGRTIEEREELRRSRWENKILREERELPKNLMALFAMEDETWSTPRCPLLGTAPQQASKRPRHARGGKHHSRSRIAAQRHKRTVRRQLRVAGRVRNLEVGRTLYAGSCTGEPRAAVLLPARWRRGDGQVAGPRVAAYACLRRRDNHVARGSNRTVVYR
jgi:hypothetical protein